MELLFLSLIAITSVPTSISGSTNSIGNNSALQLVHVIFQHGDRTPLNAESFLNDADWPQGYDELTNLGKLHSFELGQLLRTRYSNYLNTQYLTSQVSVRSTDEDKTLESAELILAGLYPPKGNDVWNQDLQWQPIPVHTSPENVDVLFSRPYCPTYAEQLIRVREVPEIVEFNNLYTDLYQYLTNVSGIEITNSSGVKYLYQTLQIMSSNNLQLPQWSNSVYPEAMKAPAVYSDTVDTYSTEMKRIMTGPILNDILQHIENTSMPEAQLYLYSGTDINIAAILNTLNLFNPPEIPQFASALLFELYQGNVNQSAPYVQLWYRTSPEAENPILLTIPGCSPECPLTIFQSIISQFIPSNWYQECSNEPTESSIFTWL